MSHSVLTVLNLYKLNGSATQFTAAIESLAKRVQREGHPGVLSYRFFVNASEGNARAVIDYADPAAWIGHHDLAMNWPEMKALHTAATLIDVTFLGPQTAQLAEWLRNSAISARLHHGYDFAAGFRR